MTEDNSPENLRKFLESDDPAMVRMGLSMAKGSGVPEELYKIIFGLSLWNPEEEIREASGEMVKEIGLENIPEFQLPNYIDSKFMEGLYSLDNLEILESATRALKNIDDVRAVGLLIEILDLIPVDSHDSEIEAITNALEELEDTRAVEPLIRIVDNCDKVGFRDNHIWEPEPSQSEFVFWAIEALGRIGDTRAIESLMNALYWEKGYIENSPKWQPGYTDIFTWNASKALAKILLKFEDGIPEKYDDAATASADNMIWLIREDEYRCEELYDLLEPLSKLAEIGWDAEKGDYVTGLCGWDPEFFWGELNGEEFDLKAFLSNRKK